MPTVNSEMFDPSKSKVREMELILDENDDLLDCIKQTMKTNGLHRCNVISLEGKMNNLNVNCFENSSLRSNKYLEPHEILKGNGEFKYDVIQDRIFGRVRIIYRHKEKSYDGIVMGGKAADGFKIVISYLETVE